MLQVTTICLVKNNDDRTVDLPDVIRPNRNDENDDLQRKLQLRDLLVSNKPSKKGKVSDDNVTAAVYSVMQYIVLDLPCLRRRHLCGCN